VVKRIAFEWAKFNRWTLDRHELYATGKELRAAEALR